MNTGYSFIFRSIEDEIETARKNYEDFNSAHEGYSILLEEVDELWDHVKVKQKKRNINAMRKEAIQVAAMAIRFALDCCDKDGNGYGK